MEFLFSCIATNPNDFAVSNKLDWHSVEQTLLDQMVYHVNAEIMPKLALGRYHGHRACHGCFAG